MLSFIKKYFLGRYGKQDAITARKSIMENDHRAYLILLGIVFVAQLGMLIMSFFGQHNEGILHYRWLYIGLMIVCVLSAILAILIYKKNKPLLYFAIVTTAMNFIILWAAGISLCDSYFGTPRVDMTVFAFVSIGMMFITILIPWVSSLSLVILTTLFTLAMRLLVVEKIEGMNSLPTGFYINIVSILIIGILGCTFNYYRRIKAINMQSQINTLNSSLKNQAYMDELTQLYNRRYLTTNIGNELNYGAKCSGVMLFDIDHFKNINDTYGHQIGDDCLQDLGKLIRKFMEDKKGYCVRYGGEEFLIFLESTNRDELFTWGLDFKEVVKKHKVSLGNGRKFSFKISIGLALAEENMSYHNLINRADLALYKAKINRDTVCFYDKD